MKRIFLFIYILFLSQVCFSQNSFKAIDKELNAANSDSSKGTFLLQLYLLLFIVTAHRGVGIVKPSKGNIYYTDFIKIEPV